MPPSHRPRRVAHATYVRRRVVVGLLAGGALLVALLTVRAVLGGGGAGDTVTADAGATVDAAGTVTSPDGTVPVSTAQPATTAAPTTAAPTTSTIAPHDDDWTPTSEEPATLYIAGDSDAGTFGPYLEDLMEATGLVRTVLDYKVSSGLSRPDFYDWPARFTEELPAVNPDIVVVTFGGNDAQGISVADGTFVAARPSGDDEADAEWRAEYGKRVGAVMDQLSAEGRTLIWVGIPNDDDPEVTARMQVQDEVVKAEAAKRPDVVMIDTWSRFSGRNGGWAAYVIDPRDGTGQDVRAADGFHLNETGAEILALDIAQAVRGALRDLGAEI